MQQVLILQVYTSPHDQLQLLLFNSIPIPVEGHDFRLNDRVLRFRECQKRKCLTLQIVNDELNENIETFNLTLQPSDQGYRQNITLHPNVTAITIVDDECMLFISLVIIQCSIYTCSLQLLLSDLREQSMTSRKTAVISESVFRLLPLQ